MGTEDVKTDCQPFRRAFVCCPFSIYSLRTSLTFCHLCEYADVAFSQTVSSSEDFQSFPTHWSFICDFSLQAVLFSLFRLVCSSEPSFFNSKSLTRVDPVKNLGIAVGKNLRWISHTSIRVKHLRRLVKRLRHYKAKQSVIFRFVYWCDLPIVVLFFTDFKSLRELPTACPLCHQPNFPLN